MSEEGIKFTVYPLPSAMMLQHDLSPEMVNILNKYLNNLRIDENKTSSGDVLSRSNLFRRTIKHGSSL